MLKAYNVIITPGLHIRTVFNHNFNLKTPIREVGGVILFIDFCLYFYHYAVAYVNITTLDLLDKLLTVLRINKINPTFIRNILNILLLKSKVLLLMHRYINIVGINRLISDRKYLERC